jgi:mannitol-specific phosphotransferase system IIBC component
VNQSPLTDQRVALAGGTLLSVLANLHSGELVKTAVLAAVGATVSFIVSCLLKKLAKRLRR